ncbi:unnamed protein product [Rhizophagus irregularis]|nr:unnamed protein product [Rhizophagus irregularis]CAB5134931.1 unnamed protein product [Rhizophagus irregularis]
MVFRRCLNHVVKKSLPYDGKNLSRVAAHIWREATMEEKKCYVDLTKLLKEQHSKIYPNHIEKRHRKPRINFVYCNKKYKSPNLQIDESCGINIITGNQEGNGVSCSYKQINCQVRETGRVNFITENQEGNGVPCSYKQINCQVRETSRTNITQEQVNEMNPLPYEYGHADGLDTFLAQQQYQQNSFYYSAPETCQTFYIGDSNAGFYGNHISNYYADFLRTEGNNCD